MFLRAPFLFASSSPMIIRYRNFRSRAMAPLEGNAIAPVDADTEMSKFISSQRLEPVSRKAREISERRRRANDGKFSSRGFMERDGYAPPSSNRSQPAKDVSRRRVREAVEHHNITPAMLHDKCPTRRQSAPASASSAACSVSPTSCAVCAVERNITSLTEGGSSTPRSSIAR